MRVLMRAYDSQDRRGTGTTFRAIEQWLNRQGDTVWMPHTAIPLDDVRAWQPDIVIGQQWATEEASQWATALGTPFVMVVHGPGQYEYFMPQCDLVVFNTYTQLDLARPALGATPALVVHPPVFRTDYATAGAGSHLTLIGLDMQKGLDRFIPLAHAFPGEHFLLVTDLALPNCPPNLEICPRPGDMRAVYARTKLLLMPSHCETYGRVAIEAAMSGIPTVASDLAGIREATTGYARLVGPGEDWAEVVRHVLAHLEPYRQAARRLAEERDPTAELTTLRDRLQQCVAAGRRRPTLSLCMTVANEAVTLEQAVSSVAPYVDQIIIGVDEKSSDATAALAQRLATDYFEYTETSPPDFPRMRNRALARVQTDWALVLDGHEWIEHGDCIRAALETTAWSIEIQTLYEPDENRVPGLAFLFPRLHRRHVRFVGASAHEEVATPSERRNQRPEIKVWHERKPGTATVIRSREKTGAELDILRTAWQNQGDRRALFYLANGLREAGRYAEAIAAYETYLQQPNFAEEGWLATLYLGRCHAAEGSWQAAQRVFERVVLDMPERAEAHVALGHTLLALGEARRAATWFRLAATLPEPKDCRLFIEVPVYRWGAWHGLALALDRLGDFAGAAEAEACALGGGAGAWAAQNIAWWRGRAATT